MQRDREYPLTVEQAVNMADLLARVNVLLERLKLSVYNDAVSSGYRPGKFNKAAGGAQNSGHLMCRAIDLADPLGKLDKAFLENQALLKELGLYLEHPQATPGWAHIDTKPRKNTVFIPS